MASSPLIAGMQRFLRNAVQTQGNLVGHPSQLGCHVERHRDTRLRAHLFTAPPQRVHQTEVLEQGGVQLVGQQPEIVPQRDRLSLQAGQFVVHRLQGAGEPPPEGAQRDRKRGEALPHVVVQLAGDACPFDFLRGNQPAREFLILLMALAKRRLAFAQLGFGPLALGDVDAGTDVSREGPVGRKARDP